MGLQRVRHDWVTSTFTFKGAAEQDNFLARDPETESQVTSSAGLQYHDFEALILKTKQNKFFIVLC